MSRSGQPSQDRIAEKLTIIYERGTGLLTRLYDLKKTLANAESRPAVFSEKSLEGILSRIDKKFNPTSCNSQNYGSSMSAPIRTEILKTLNQHYFTLVDVMDFKNNVGELLVKIDVNQIHFDISVNFDLTKTYLDVIVVYVSLMIMLSRIEDRKAMLGLYNIAHELQHSHGEPAFPRLGQMMIEYDPPMRKLCEEFVPHVKTLTIALLSLKVCCIQPLIN